LVYFHLAFGAGKMAVQFDVATTGTGSFARRVDRDPVIALDLEQMFPGRFLLLIDALELERIEPDASASPFTHIHADITNLLWNQFVVTCGTFHGRTYHSADSIACQVPVGAGLTRKSHRAHAPCTRFRGFLIGRQLETVK
jgi:hypothetical protein